MTNLKKYTREKVITLRRGLTAAALFFLAAAAVAIFSSGSHAGWGTGNANNTSQTPNAKVSAAIEPKDIALGEAAILVVQVSGEDADQPALAPVDGLRFYAMGRSSQYQSINGRVSATTSYLFQVQAEHTGDFVIPPVEASVAGRIHKSEPVSLRVAKGMSRPPAQGALPFHNQGARKSAGNNHTNKITKGQLMSWEEGKPAFLRVLPKAGQAYVGELLPMEIKAYFHQGVQATLRTLPTIKGGAFACRELRDKPMQTQEVLDGIPYNVLTWYTAMSAVKEGEHPVMAELDAALGIPERSRRRTPFGHSLFDDDFFNGFFQNIHEESVKLNNPHLKIRVLPLPKLGRPKDFSGAVGSFKLTASATPQKAVVGDPISIKMRITGTGNFDRVATPVLDADKAWKIYKSSSSFKPSDSAGFTGEKSFEQAVIPMNGSIKTIPPVTFSYFDTDKEKYVTLHSKTIPLTLISATTQGSVSMQAAETDVDMSKPDRMDPKKDHKGLAPIHVAMGSSVKSLQPLVENPWFMGAQSFPVGALFLGLFFSRKRKKRSNDPGIIRKKQVKQKVSQSIRKMDRAIAGHDTATFFHACRTASQERLGEIWGQTPKSITLAEIKSRLGDNAGGMATVFEKADAAAYSGQSFGPEELRKLRDLVVRELDDLNHAPPASLH